MLGDVGEPQPDILDAGFVNLLPGEPNNLNIIMVLSGSRQLAVLVSAICNTTVPISGPENGRDNGGWWAVFGWGPDGLLRVSRHKPGASVLRESGL